MSMIASAEREMILRGSGRDEGIRDSQAGREAEFLHIDRSSMADVLGQRQDRKSTLHEEGFYETRLALAGGALEKLHVTDNGQPAVGILIDEPGRSGVSPEDPDKDVRVIEHGASSGV